MEKKNVAKRNRLISGAILAGLSAAWLGVPDATIGATCSPTTFITAPEYPAGLSPTSIAVADLNRDGNPDVVAIPNYCCGGQLSILFGNGDGTLGAPSVISLNNYTSLYSVALADLNQDGNSDIVVGAYGSIYVLLGNGDGTFQPTLSMSVPNNSYLNLALGDFNGDGVIDIAAVGIGGSVASILLGVGDGTFGAATNISTGVASNGISLADLDSNGTLDIITTNSNNNTVSVLMGHGDGTFGSARQFAAGSVPSALTVGDFNSDGKLDLAVSIQGYVVVLLGNGDGSFLAPLEFPITAPAVGLLTADLTGDGVLDLAVLESYGYNSYAPGQVEVLAGGGNGLFASVGSFKTGPAPVSVAVSDLNSDGFPDLLAANSVDNSVSVLIGFGAGEFQAIRSQSSAGTNGDWVTADFNGDGLPDLASITANSVILFLGTPDGSFHLIGTIYEPNLYGLPIHLFSAADFNGDGRVDLAILDSPDGMVVVLPGNGDGTFGNTVTTTIPNFYYGSGVTAVGDLNGDGFPDLLYVDDSDNFITLLGNGDGTFRQGPSMQETPPSGPMMLVDLNADGKLDLVAPTASYGSPVQVTVYLGNGDGSFQSPVGYSAGQGTDSLVVGDFNGDGNADVIAANGGSENLTVFLGNGDGTLQSTYTIGLASSPVSLTAADFNGDGLLDLLTTSSNNSASLLLGTGSGTFQSPENYPVGSNPLSSLVVDLTGSGAIDAIIENTGDGTFSMLINSKLSASPPIGEDVCIGSSAVFAVAASGFGPVTYQWRKNGINLTDGGNISGSQTPTLTINPAGASDAASYDVVVADLCTQTTSAEAALTVSQQPAPPTITAPLTAPPAQPGIIASVPDVTGHTFDWTVTGGTITYGQGTHQIVLTAGPAGTTMSVEVVELASAGCMSAPSTALIQVDFLDVPASNPFHNFVDTIARNAITAGCGNGDYCPNASIQRNQMAVFMMRAVHGPTYVPPPATGTMFSDVPANAFGAAFIEEAGREGIMGVGEDTTCGAGMFCPADAVTRLSMAYILLRGEHSGSYVPPSANCGSFPFVDVPCPSTDADFVAQLLAEGITAGCDATHYCPANPVNRAQMAVFLVATFNLQ